MGKKLEKLFQILDWDSKFFGYKVAKIVAPRLAKDELEPLLEKLTSENVRLVYWFVDPGDKASNGAARGNGGFLADEKVTYATILSDRKKHPFPPAKIKPYLLKPINKRLVSLALQAGVNSRYRIDPHFCNQEFERLYKKWLENSLNGEIAEEVFVFLEKNKEVGLLTLGVKNNRADIGLLAVDRKFRRGYVGTDLVHAAFAKARQLGYSAMQVVSQKNNTIAGRFYEKLGFTVESVVNVYHFWLNGQKT